MSNSDIQEIELNIQRAKKTVELGDALERLASNRDFKTVISEGYFEREAIRLVHLKADPAMKSPAHQQSILAQIDAIGSLHQYFNSVFQQAAMAMSSIASDEEARDEMLAEELAR